MQKIKLHGQTAVFEAALLFARTEGIIPVPESAHAIKAAIDEALKATVFLIYHLTKPIYRANSLILNIQRKKLPDIKF